MEEIKGVARAVIRPGKLGENKALCEQAMEIVRTQDTDTLQTRFSSTPMKANRSSTSLSRHRCGVASCPYRPPDGAVAGDGGGDR